MTLSSCSGTSLASGIGGTFDDGFGPVNITVCFETGLNGLVVDVGGGTYPDDISWSLTFPSGIVESGVAGPRSLGECGSPYPSIQPSRPCELYTIELYDSYGDG